VGKERVAYKAGDLIILKPMLAHAGDAWNPRVSTEVNTRLFYSVTQKLDLSRESQRWFYERGHFYTPHKEGFGAFTRKLSTCKEYPFSYMNDSDINYVCDTLVV
jgi:hypothetical protein